MGNTLISPQNDSQNDSQNDTSRWISQRTSDPMKWFIWNGIAEQTGVRMLQEFSIPQTENAMEKVMNNLWILKFYTFNHFYQLHKRLWVWVTAGQFPNVLVNKAATQLNHFSCYLAFLFAIIVTKMYMHSIGFSKTQQIQPKIEHGHCCHWTNCSGLKSKRVCACYAASLHFPPSIECYVDNIVVDKKLHTWWRGEKMQTSELVQTQTLLL